MSTNCSLFHTSALPFDVINNPKFPIMIKKVARFGIGLKPSSYHEMRVTFFNKEVKNVMVMLEEFKVEWKRTGCTIMSDGWSDKKDIQFVTFLRIVLRNGLLFFY